MDPESGGTPEEEANKTPTADTAENWLAEQRPEAIRERAEAYLEQVVPTYKRAVEERQPNMSMGQVPVEVEESVTEFELWASMMSKFKREW